MAAEIDSVSERIRRLPPNRQLELLDFIAFLETRSQSDAFESMLLAEPGLARDWDTPEEDLAWASL